MSPTARSMKLLRDQGYIVAIVEKTVPRTFIKQDLFGFADLIAVKPGVTGSTYVQVTSGSNVSARLKKIQMTAEAGIVLAARNPVLVHGWAKQGAKGKRKVWTCREIVVDFINQPTGGSK